MPTLATGRLDEVDEAPPPPDDAEALGPDADHEAVARKILLDQLTGQARSRAELATKLAKKQVPAEVADRLLDRFEEVGLVDDAAFARDWVQSRQAGRGLARRALAVELRRKGVDPGGHRRGGGDRRPRRRGRGCARSSSGASSRRLQRFDDVPRSRRLTGMLARKGYPSGVASGWCARSSREAPRGAAGRRSGEWASLTPSDPA